MKWSFLKTDLAERLQKQNHQSIDYLYAYRNLRVSGRDGRDCLKTVAEHVMAALLRAGLGIQEPRQSTPNVKPPLTKARGLAARSRSKRGRNEPNPQPRAPYGALWALLRGFASLWQSAR